MEIYVIRLPFNPPACVNATAIFDSVSNQHNSPCQASLLKENSGQLNTTSPRFQTSHLEISALYQAETLPGVGTACQKRSSYFVFSLFFFTSYTDEAFPWTVAHRGRGIQRVDANIVPV